MIEELVITKTYSYQKTYHTLTRVSFILKMDFRFRSVILYISLLYLLHIVILTFDKTIALQNNHIAKTLAI